MALEKDDPRFEYKKIGEKLYKIDTKGELPPELAIDVQEPPELRSDPKTVYGNFVKIIQVMLKCLHIKMEKLSIEKMVKYLQKINLVL